MDGVGSEQVRGYGVLSQGRAFDFALSAATSVRLLQIATLTIHGIRCAEAENQILNGTCKHIDNRQKDGQLW